MKMVGSRKAVQGRRINCCTLKGFLRLILLFLLKHLLVSLSESLIIKSILIWLVQQLQTEKTEPQW